MNSKKITMGVSALIGFSLLASGILIAVLPPVYRSPTVTILDGSTGFVVLGDHQAYAINTHPDFPTPRVYLIGDWSVRDNEIKIESPEPKLQCKSMQGQMYWNRIDWKIELEAKQAPIYLTDRQVFMPWSIIEISRHIHKKPNKP